MADIEIVNSGDDDAELLLTDTIDGGEGDDSQPGAEAIDEIDYPDTLDDDDDPANNTPLAKHLRDQLKERNRLIRDKDRELEQLRGKTAPQRYKKPELWNEGEGDEDKYDALMEEWRANEQAVENAATATTSVQRQASQRTEQQLTAYRNDVAKLAKPDFKTSEDAVVAAMTNEQQIVLIKVAKHPAKFIDALGRSPMRLAQLAEITDLIELAAEVARIEGKSMMARKEPANIDTPLRGQARLSVETVDKKEDALVKEAQRTGSIDKLRAYRKEQRSKAA